MLCIILCFVFLSLNWSFQCWSGIKAISVLIWPLPRRVAQATGIAKTILRKRFWKSSCSHFPTAPHGIKKTLLTILHFSNFLCARSMQTSLHSLNIRCYLCSIPGTRFCVCATGCIISWQSRADGPQSHGEFGCSSGETRLLCTLDICCQVRKMKNYTLNASACHRKYHMREN